MDGIIWFDPKILCLVPKEEDEGGYGKGSKYSRRKIFSQQREEERRKRTKIYLKQEREREYSNDMRDKKNMTWNESFLLHLL